MRFLFLLYGDQSTWGNQSEAEHRAEMAAFASFERQATDAGVLTTNYALQPAVTATTLRHTDAGPAISDGPPDGPPDGDAERLGAVYVVTCQDAAEAAAWAAKIPLVGPGGFSAIEIRPVLGE